MHIKCVAEPTKLGSKFEIYEVFQWGLRDSNLKKAVAKSIDYLTFFYQLGIIIDPGFRLNYAGVIC